MDWLIYHPSGRVAFRWTLQKLRDVQCKFMELDHDHDGFLTQDELALVRPAQEGISSMVPYFVQRVFEQHVRQCPPCKTVPGMSIAEFVDFLMAWNHRGQDHSTKCALRSQRPVIAAS